MSDPAFLALQSRVSHLIAHARREHPLGVTAYTPAAFGEEYPALYVRDFTYMAESAPEFIPAGHVRAVIALLVAHLSPAGLCPERIGNDGEIFYVCHGAKPAADSPLFLAKLCGAYARHGGDRAFLGEILPALQRTLGTVPVEPDTGLVWIDPAAPHTAYGFTDTIAITGRHLFCSLLRLEAWEIFARLATELGRPAEAEDATREAQRVRAHLGLLWSEEHHLYLAGSHDCRQADVWGSAYAGVIGAVDATRRREIAQTLLAQRDRFSCAPRSGTCCSRRSGRAGSWRPTGRHRAVSRTAPTGALRPAGSPRTSKPSPSARASPSCASSPPTSPPTASGNASAPTATPASPTTSPPPACRTRRGKK